MDKLDKQIINELAFDAKKKSSEIATKLGVSDTTVRRRIKRMVESGSLQFTISPTPQSMGFNMLAIIGLQVELGKIDEIEKELSAYPNIRFIADCTGSYDMFIGTWFESSADLNRFVKDSLAKMPSIKKSETFIILDVKKNEVGWLKQH